MTSQLPEKARCKRCRREFEIEARYPGLRSRPMLVVLSEVASVQEALANAQCQDCLALGGPANKGLELVLKGLSAPTSSTAPAPAASADEFDGNDPGSNALLRVLFDGRPVTRGALGPQYLSADIQREIWVVGTLRVDGGTATWTTINRLLSRNNAPVIPPEMWSTGL